MMNFSKLTQKYQIFLLPIVCSGIFLSVVSLFNGTLAVAVMLVVFLGAVAFLFIGKSKEHAKILGLLFLIVFVVHILATLFVFYANFQPFSGGRGDHIEYNNMAQEISNRVHSGNFSFEGIGMGHYYPVIVGYLYALTTPSVLIGELFNAWLIALLVIVVYFITLELGASKKEAFIVGLIANFYPSLAFFGSLLLKEALAGLLCVLALLMMLKIIKEFSWPKFLIFYLLLLGVTHFRFYISNALTLSFIICWPFLSNFKIKKRLLYWILTAALLGFLPNISGGSGAGNQYFQLNAMKQYLTPQVITNLREETTSYDTGKEIAISQSNQNQPVEVKPPSNQNQPVKSESKLAKGSESSVIIKTGLENPFTFLRNTIWSSISALLGPFPWQLKKPQQFLILPEAIAWYFLLFFIVRGIIKCIKTKYKVIIPLVLFSVLVFGVLGVFINNYGITTRIRIPAVLSLLCLFPLGFKGLKKSLKDVKIPFLNNLDEPKT